MKMIKLTDEEEYSLFRALEYFAKEERNEIRELLLPGGNREFTAECEKRLKIFESIISKCRKLDIGLNLSEEEHYYFSRAISYFWRAEKRELDNLDDDDLPTDSYENAKKRLDIYESIITNFGLKKFVNPLKS